MQPRSLDNPAKAIPEMLVSTGADGAYRWSLPPGRYEITVAVPWNAAGNLPKVVEIQAGQTITLDFTV